MAGISRRPGNLPAEATSFVGRRKDLAELREKLSGRLVTLVGPGGVGKTRLAIRAARDLGRGFRHGAWLVGLAEVRRSALVGSAVLAALDLRDQAGMAPASIVVSFLADKELLLVVDNCEHQLPGVVPLLQEILNGCGGVRIIATSREPLSIPGEHVLPVPPLPLPSGEPDEPLPQLRQNEAVMLFIDRASAASGRFELTADNRTAVLELCRRLDGLPLAIELAAVRTRVLAPDQILNRLSSRFDLLTAGGYAALPRHQTLRTTIDWSYELLSAEESQLFRRLCVFAGRFNLEDVEGVCSSDGGVEVLDDLSSLVEKSLVIKEDVQGGVAFYGLHETVREYASLKLGEAGENSPTEERLVAYFVERAERSAIKAPFRLVEWLAWVDQEIENLRWVLRRSLNDGDVQRGLSLAVSLRFYWLTRATSEGARVLDELLASGTASVDLRARAYHVRTLLAWWQADLRVGPTAAERAVSAAREVGRSDLLAPALSAASVIENLAGNRAGAADLLSEAERITAGVDDYLAGIMLLEAAAFKALVEEDLEAARATSSLGSSRSREAGDLHGLAFMLMNLGAVALIAGDLERAKTQFADTLRVAVRIDDRIAQYYALEGLGRALAGTGQARLAARLLGAADAIRIATGTAVMPGGNPQVSRAKEPAIAALGTSIFEAEFEAGKQLKRESAIAMALDDPARIPAVSSKTASPGSLGSRELEVARLVAEGLTNKQIGARLFISERTVESHVRSALNKLGFTSRAQIAGWVASSKVPST